MGYNSFSTGIYSNIVEPNEAPSGICILKLFLRVPPDEQSRGAFLGAPLMAAVPGAEPCGRVVVLSWDAR